MTFTLNGNPADLPAGTTLADIVTQLDLPGRGIALALDGEVVARSAWSQTVVPERGRVDIVTAMQGG